MTPRRRRPTPAAPAAPVAPVVPLIRPLLTVVCSPGMEQAAERFTARFPAGMVRVRVSELVHPGRLYVSREPQERPWTPSDGRADALGSYRMSLLEQPVIDVDRTARRLTVS